jgi:heterodisulfide reductase subunit B
LAIAADQDGISDIVAPCSACFLNLKKTDNYMGKYEKIEKLTNEALAAGGLSYTPGSLNVRHLIEVVVDDLGYETIEKKVTHPLKGLRVAPYYGCLIVRPQFDEEGFDNPEYPMHLDRLMDVLGADVVDFPMKAHCCGGHMTQISSDTAFELIRRLLKNASDYEADAIVTVCPMCQLNLDAYQSQVNRHFGTNFDIPILYFTQMMGLAMGLQPKELGIGKEIVSAATALRKIGAEVEEAPAPARRKRRDDPSLPMPSMRGE